VRTTFGETLLLWTFLVSLFIFLHYIHTKADEIATERKLVAFHLFTRASVQLSELESSVFVCRVLTQNKTVQIWALNVVSDHTQVFMISHGCSPRTYQSRRTRGQLSVRIPVWTHESELMRCTILNSSDFVRSESQCTKF
jgi:hypothetical protein